uniref:tRNA Ile-lysidine synthetase n=1 Tax=Hypnea cervicornis TaxID=387623 RepID=UPI0021B4F830|nr:tRNA Ile-lysidine synthetase [Hypnea cervicornis]UVW80786.1 tRNA Ile-lysidine synthetase [Hypnea cervicornis]
MQKSIQEKFNQKFNIFLSKNHLHTILIAISGGQDSICLVNLVENFQKKFGKTINITYIYIDHQWTKKSEEQVKHLINIFEKTKKKFVIYQINQLINSELKARELRYNILTKYSKQHGYKYIITAHTQTDKTETFLQHLIRGTSLNGITSFNEYRKFCENIYIYRPLLELKRKEIKWLCRKSYLPIWSDITNYHYTINRNRLRHELIPYINKYFNHNIDKQINNFLINSKLDNEYINQNAIKLYLHSRHKINIAINYKLIYKQHIALQIRTLQIFFFIIHNKILI